MKANYRSAVLGAILLIGASSAPALADDAKPTVKDRLLEVLRQKNVITEAEYADLKSLAEEMRHEEATDKAALEREIERYVSEAQAKGSGDKSASNLQTGWEKNTGFYGKSADGNFSIALGGYLQVRYTYADADTSEGSSSTSSLDPMFGFLLSSQPSFGSGDASDISIERGRFRVSGNIIDPTIKYFMQIETAGSAAALLDYYIDYTRFDPFNVRMGQYKVPFGRQQLTSASKLTFMDRTRPTNALTPGRNGGAGVMAHGDLGGDNDDLFEYYAGVFNGEGINTSGNDGPGLLGAARVAVNPLGAYGYEESDLSRSEDLRLTFGAGIVYDADDNVTVPVVGPVGDVDTTTWGIDAGAKWSGLAIQAEYMMANFDPDVSGSSDFDVTGWYAQAGYLIPETDFEVAARYGMLTDDDGFFGGSDNDFDEWSLGANYYFSGHNAKLQADWTRYTFDPDSGSEVDDDLFRIQVQLMF